MKRLVWSGVLVLCFASPSLLFAQALKDDHVEIGAFADDFRMDRTNPALNYAGVGGRAGFNLRPSAQIEAEMAYDFDRSYRNPFTNGTVVPSKTPVLHALFGPKLQTGSGWIRLFVTGKVGLINFSTNSLNAPAGFKSSLGAVGDGDAKFALYPRAGS